MHHFAPSWGHFVGNLWAVALARIMSLTTSKEMRERSKRLDFMRFHGLLPPPHIALHLPLGVVVGSIFR